MSYQVVFSFTFTNLPSLTLNAELYDATGAQTGSTITSGFVNLGNGAYHYLATIPDHHVGTLVIYDSAQPSRCIAFAVNPLELQYVLDLWARIVGAATANAADPTSVAYKDHDGNTRITHTLTDTARAVS